MLPADISKEEQVEQLAPAMAARWSKVHILVNNAGVNVRNTIVEEVGALALYLCSEGAGFITGTDILIDGGWCAQ